MSVVFPEPKNPVSMVTGTGGSWRSSVELVESLFVADANGAGGIGLSLSPAGVSPGKGSESGKKTRSGASSSSLLLLPSMLVFMVRTSLLPLQLIDNSDCIFLSSSGSFRLMTYGGRTSVCRSLYGTRKPGIPRNSPPHPKEHDCALLSHPANATIICCADSRNSYLGRSQSEQIQQNKSTFHSFISLPYLSIS